MQKLLSLIALSTVLAVMIGCKGPEEGDTAPAKTTSGAGADTKTPPANSATLEPGKTGEAGAGTTGSTSTPTAPPSEK